MFPLVLAVWACTVAAAVYAGIGLRRRRRTRLGREITARVAGLDLDPYFAAMILREGTEAAAAELLLGGYVRMDAEGLVRPTEEGPDRARTPAHPLPAALLDAVRRYRDTPGSFRWIDRHDTEYGERSLAFWYDRFALLPPVTRMPKEKDRPLLGCLTLLVVVLQAEASSG
ncbi:hypothetical protein ACGFYQ_14680 [Streptomyces sp. NPDC048258]|uniref:hypothetical protein n=1 Tax=Streptomyces sp. NPDC048258 TaxID=3365527 RepID=UPI003723F62A